MVGNKPFPPQQEGCFYLYEGGTETELMYKYGFELPHFAMFPLLNNPDAVLKMSEMFRSYLDVAAKHKMCALMGGLEEGDPVELGQQCGDLARRYSHMDIWGGCCGTWSNHLDEIAKNVIAA